MLTSLDRKLTEEILNPHPNLARWIDDFLQSRTFNRIDGKVIGSTMMTGGTPHKTPH